MISKVPLIPRGRGRDGAGLCSAAGCPVSDLAVTWQGSGFSLKLFSLGLEKLMKPFFSPQSKASRAGMGMKRPLTWGTGSSIESVRFLRINKGSLLFTLLFFFGPNMVLCMGILLNGVGRLVVSLLLVLRTLRSPLASIWALVFHAQAFCLWVNLKDYADSGL